MLLFESRYKFILHRRVKKNFDIIIISGEGRFCQVFKEKIKLTKLFKNALIKTVKIIKKQVKLPKESEIQKGIIDYLNLKKIFNYKNNTVGIFKKATGSYIPSQSAGCPDITCIIDGKYIGIEVKRPKCVQTYHQLRFEQEIKKAGGEYYVIRSLNELIECLKNRQ